MGFDPNNNLTPKKSIGNILAESLLGSAAVYDGDENRVQSTVNNVTTTFVGNYYELTGSQVTKYYFAGAQRVAMRKYTIPQPMTVEYLLGDHLGSTSITTDSTGARVSEIRYKPWGEIRYSWTSGVVTTPSYSLVNYTFTGQFSDMDDPTTTGTTEGFGLLFYNARFYDPVIGRFTSADSLVPGGVQGLDRYAYVNNSPLNYTDPSGNTPACEEDCTHAERFVPLLSKKAKQLKQYADENAEGKYWRVIQIGIAKELAGWGLSSDRVDEWSQHFRNRYVEYVRNSCAGATSENCLLNFVVSNYQSIYRSTVLNHPNGLPEPLEDYGEVAFARAGDVIDDFSHKIDWSYNPQPAASTDRNKPYGVGIYTKKYLKMFQRTLGGHWRLPTQGTGYNQFLYVEKIFDENGKVVEYSVIMSWCQEKYWTSGQKYC